MEKQKMEDKVRELFEKQDFKLEKTPSGFQASKEGMQLDLQIFSSEDHSVDSVVQKSTEGAKIFVDEELRKVKDIIENDVSVLKENKGSESFDIPSYERIGGIVVISELDGIDRDEAVEAVREHNPGIDSILLKSGKLSGEFRVGDYEVLYGGETETIHKEHGCRIKVDPTEMFFSEREGTERRRIFESVKEGEEVLVMFSGAGPFPITIARKSSPAKVVGVEKNPESVSMARENIELNSVEDKVEIIEGDVSDVCPELGKFDRVLMPSPTNSLEFLEEAINSVKQEGVLVVYSIEEKDSPYENVVQRVRKEANRHERVVEVLEKRVVSDYSPQMQKVAVEFRVS